MVDFLERRRAQIAQEALERATSGEIGPDDEAMSGLPDHEVATKYHEQTGCWMHRFADVRAEGGVFFITHESNPDAWRMQPGDLIQDAALNPQPYWKVVSNDRFDRKRVVLEPIEPNPLLTGVGAGGAVITAADVKVLTGEYEHDRVAQIHAAIEQGTITNIDEVRYILLGTVGVNFGPNGPQGGWYSASDTSANRGGRQRMTAEQIVVRDATFLRSLGFAVPDAAIDGAISPYLWSQFIGNPPGMFRDWRDVGSEEWDLLDLPDDNLRSPQSHVQMRGVSTLIAAIMSRYLADPDLSYRALRNFIRWGKGHWLVNETIINWVARYLNDTDLLRAATKLPDGTNRRWAYAALAQRLDPLPFKAVFTEDNPEALCAIASAMNESYMPRRHVAYFLLAKLARIVVEGDGSHARFYAHEALASVIRLARRQGLDTTKAMEAMDDYEKRLRSNPGGLDDAAWVRHVTGYMRAALTGKGQVP